MGYLKKGKCVNSLPSTHFCVLLLLSCLLIITLINELQCLHNVENPGSWKENKVAGFVVFSHFSLYLLLFCQVCDIDVYV